MANVEVNMLPKYSQPATETEKVKDPLSFHPSKSRFRLPGVKDLVIGIAILSCIVALCFLSVKIYTVEQKISLQSQATSSSVDMDATSGIKDGIQSIRRRRDASETGGAHNETASNAANTYVSNLEIPQAHPFIHVTGLKNNTPKGESKVKKGEWFTWHSDKEASYQNLATSLIPFVHSQFVQIVQPGYYFVYSQVTISEKSHENGHEIVKKANCGKGGDQRLLKSTRYQIPTVNGFYPEDSGYAGGVFYLSANDRVGVRPFSHRGPEERRFIANQPTGSYFGMFMLSLDPSARVAKMGECPDQTYF